MEKIDVYRPDLLVELARRVSGGNLDLFRDVVALFGKSFADKVAEAVNTLHGPFRLVAVMDPSGRAGWAYFPEGAAGGGERRAVRPAVRAVVKPGGALPGEGDAR